MADFLCRQLKAEYEQYKLQEIKRNKEIIMCIRLVVGSFSTGAVYRHFESRRRKYNDSLPRRKKMVETNNKNAKKKGFNKRVR